MQGGGFLRILLIAVAGFFLYRYLLGGGSHGSTQAQPVAPEAHLTPESRAPYQYCDIQSDYFHARLSTRGAALRNFELRKPKYQKHGVPIDLSTTPHPGVALDSPQAEDPSAPGLHEFRQQLFSQWRTPTIPVHVIYAPNRYLSAKVRVFIDWAVTMFERHDELRRA